MCFCIGAMISYSPETTSSTSNPKDTEAQQAWDRAEELRAKWDANSLRQAKDEYNKAALLWTSISSFSNASKASLKSGDVHFLCGEYKQALERYQNAEALAEKSDDWLVKAIALSQIGRLQSYLGNNDLAQKQLTRSLDLFKQHEANRTIDATNAYGEALTSLAEVNYAKGDVLKSSEQLESALKIFQNHRKGEARVRLIKGYIAGSTGETDKAAEEISQALELYREINDKSGEGLALTAMGLWHVLNREGTRAIEMHDKAREIFQAIGDQHSEAIALTAMGQAYEILTEYPTALSYYEKGLELFEKTGDADAVAGAPCSIAGTHLLNRNLDQALASYERCLNLSRAAKKLRMEFYALNGIATVYGAQRNYEQALKQHQKIQKFFESINDRRGQAMALNTQGDFFFQIGQTKRALDVYRQAISLSEKMGVKGIRISALFNLARANQALGNYEAALSLIRQSFNLIEEVRTNAGSPDFQASYFSGVKKHYDLCIEILMQLDRLRPGEGFAAEAFLVSEQSRSRLLLDLLSESRSKTILEGAAKELLEHERRLRGLLRLQAEHQLAPSLSGKDSTETAEAAAQLADLRSRYQVVQAQLREQNPRLFAFEQFAPVGLKRIQEELRDNTILLEYALGDEHSYLWAITSSSVQTYELPPRKEIEDAANSLYELITTRQGSGDQNASEYRARVEAADNLYFEKASNLSKMLLGPVAGQLGTRRLLVVTEGELQDIPFGALPLPLSHTAGPNGPFVVDTNEVVVLPSASTLIAIRGAQSRTSVPGKLVAIIADPVFTPTDDRVKSEALSSTTAKAATQESNQPGRLTIKNLRLARLPHAAEEADAISAGAPWGTTLVAKGFDANRETAMSAEVSRSQIVHFATHSFVHSEHPELSGIALSMIDVNGVETNGVMSLPDIYSLDLSAELIVLSACQTALGKDLKGEGLVGLTHSFMSAGANSVVASLWKVDDRATAVLMDYFYDAMLQQGMSPAAALRSAQLKLKQEPRWSSPYYWSGFVLQGEYSNHIVANRRTWWRAGWVLVVLLILIASALFVIQKRKRRIPPGQFT
jgi:CHAT domain-containing protein/lipopolysaccharide biosynthesis regulator YciM